MNVPPPATGIKRVYKAFHYSLAGFKAAYRHEAAFRQEFWLTVVLLPWLYFFELPDLTKLFLATVLFILLITELLNSAIEAIVDLASPEFHELAGRAKDLGSAAVFCSLTLALITWAWAFWEQRDLFV